MKIHIYSSDILKRAKNVVVKGKGGRSQNRENTLIENKEKRASFQKRMIMIREVDIIDLRG